MESDNNMVKNIKDLTKKAIIEDELKFPRPVMGMPSKKEEQSVHDFHKKIREKKHKLGIANEEADIMEEDMFVYPDEFKMGMKEEMEHAKTVDHDKETIKKIVLDHLREDPKYYSKLGTVMKAEEDETSDYLKSLSTRKMTPGWKPPAGPKPKTESDLPSERLSAEEDMPLKEKYFRKPESVKRQVTIPPTPREQALKSPRGLSGFILPKGKTLKDWASEVIDAFLAEEEERKPSPYAFSPYSKSEIKQHKEVVTKSPPRGPPMHRPPSPPMSKPLPKSDGPHTPKIKAAPVMSPKTQKLRQQFAVGKPKSQTVTTTPIKPSTIDIQDKPFAVKTPMEHKGEKDFGKEDYTTWQREKHEQSKRPLLQKIGEKLFGTPHMKAEEFNPAAGGKILAPVKAEEEGIMDKIKSTVKDLTSSPRPEPYVKPPPLTKKNVRQSFQHSHGASEEVFSDSKKISDEDVLNELHCFLRWMSDKGFKAETSDQFDQLMDQYKVEKFAEEAMPPAQFKAPEEKKDV